MQDLMHCIRSLRVLRCIKRCIKLLRSLRFPVLHQTLHQTPHQTLHQIASDGCIRFETPCFNPGTTRRTLLNGANPNWSTVREGDECTLKPLHQTPTGCCCIRCCIKWCAVGLLLRLHQMLHQMCVVRRPAFASNENLVFASNNLMHASDCIRRYTNSRCPTIAHTHIAAPLAVPP